MTFAELRLDVVILCCAVSAGIHAALVPAHFEEGTGPGVGFILASLAPAACAVLLTLRPSRLALVATRPSSRALIVSYLLVLASGLPVLHPEREPVEALAVWTKVIEASGSSVAAGCLRRPAAVLADGSCRHMSTGRPIPLPLTLLVAVFSALVALAVSGGMHMGARPRPRARHHRARRSTGRPAHERARRSYGVRRGAAGRCRIDCPLCRADARSRVARVADGARLDGRRRATTRSLACTRCFCVPLASRSRGAGRRFPICAATTRRHRQPGRRRRADERPPRLDDFRGASRFTTWAYKFALLEAAVKLVSARGRAASCRSSPSRGRRSRAPASSPHAELEQRALLDALGHAIHEVLTPHQRDRPRRARAERRADRRARRPPRHESQRALQDPARRTAQTARHLDECGLGRRWPSRRSG